MNSKQFSIIDCHVHFIDNEQIEYPHFQKIDQHFVNLVGDYSDLPRKYLPPDYLKETQGFNVVKTIMAEFVSKDPLKEVKWAQQLANRFGHPHGIIALASPLDPNFEYLLKEYGQIPNVRSIREHLLWDPNDPGKCFAPRNGILLEKKWRKNFAKLKKYGFNWEFEIFAHQIPEAENLAREFPDINMILHPMGWPLDLSKKGFAMWKKNMHSFSKFKNVAVKITAIGCIFKNWTIQQIHPWIREAIEIFGPHRSLLGSHMPLEKLDHHTFKQLYEAYQEIVKDMSVQDQENIFHNAALKWYRL